jgi:hypothetical protein
MSIIVNYGLPDCRIRPFGEFVEEVWQIEGKPANPHALDRAAHEG